MTAPFDRLKAALADRYTIERELGRGGMAVVYLARDLKHDRPVALKVLSADVAEGVKTERFLREIRLAANLTHTNILPVHDSGEAGGTLFYVMPYVEGESLRDRLNREKRLSVEAATQITHEVAEALRYAHAHGVVHRDIKPENILLQSGHAVVMDFGIARALSAAQGQTVTQTGTMVGTPLYMSPEQGSGQTVDGRSDVYSLGCVLYEMLAGHPPFTGQNTQEVLARHVMDAVPGLQAARAGVPENVDRAVLKALAKQPEDRFATAAQFAEALQTPNMPDLDAVARRAHPTRVAALFGLAAVGVLSLVRLLVVQLGLPDWVFTGAVALLVGGLPVVLATGHLERRRALAGETSAPGGLRRWFTWRRALLGGAVAFGGLAVVTAGYMAMRLLGIGPVGTLMATGAIGERDPLVVAEFENRTTDSTLAPSVTEAFRIDLAQSPAVKLVDGAAAGAVLQRMGRDPSTPLDARVAREIAEREGAKAFVAGEVAPLGAGFVLSARVMSATSGEVLLALRETAADQTAIIGAVDRLSAKLRERLGESLKTIRGGQPLEQVTTTSLEALRRYTQAVRASARADNTGAIPLLEEAIVADSTFAMAYRALAVALRNSQSGRSRVIAASRKAFQYRDRLPLKERYLVDAAYYTQVVPDREKTIAAYRSVLEIDPDDRTALNSLGLVLHHTRRYQEAEPLLLRALSRENASAAAFNNAIRSQVAQGKFAAAETTLALYARRWPGAPAMWGDRADLAAAQGDFAGAAAFGDSQFRAQPMESRVPAHQRLAEVALIRGKLAEAERHWGAWKATNEARGVPGAGLNGALNLALIDLQYREDRRQALRKVEEALKRTPLATLLAPDRPYLALADLYASAGRVEVARRLMAEYERDVDPALQRYAAPKHNVAGSIALAEGRLDEAVAAFRRFRDESIYPLTGLFPLADAYDRQGNVDSALVYYQQFVMTPAFGVDGGGLDGGQELRAGGRAMRLGPSYKRLGELYEQRGDREKAVDYYRKFTELWKDADPELQPHVREVRQQIARLVGER